MERVLLVAVPDLMFGSRIEAAARDAGWQVRAPASSAACNDAVAAVDAVVVDLQAAELEPMPLIERAAGAGVPVLAFGRHTDAATLRAAREAGATRVVPRSQLAEELPALLAELAAAHGADRERAPQP